MFLCQCRDVKGLAYILDLLGELLVERLILKGSFIQLLLHASLSHCFISKIIQLGNLSVRDLALSSSEDLHEVESLILAFLDFLQNFSLNISVLNLIGKLSVSIEFLVEALDILIHLLISELLLRVLDVLDTLKDQLIDQLDLRLCQDLWGGVLNKSGYQIHLCSRSLSWKDELGLNVLDNIFLE